MGQQQQQQMQGLANRCLARPLSSNSSSSNRRRGLVLQVRLNDGLVDSCQLVSALPTKLALHDFMCVAQQCMQHTILSALCIAPSTCSVTCCAVLCCRLYVCLCAPLPCVLCSVVLCLLANLIPTTSRRQYNPVWQRSPATAAAAVWWWRRLWVLCVWGSSSWW